MSSIVKFIFGKKFFLKHFRQLQVNGFRPKRSFKHSSVLREEYPTILQVKQHLLELLQVDCVVKKPKSKDHLLQYLPKSQDELPNRTIKDSFCAAIIPLSTNEEMRERYTAFWGTVRLGRLLEDVDLFAGHISYKHVKNPKFTESIGSPYTIVTAFIDQINFNYHPKPDVDIKISGNVCWVGKSSMEIVVWLHQKENGVWKEITEAFLIMAARTPNGDKPASVNRLVANNAEEREILKKAEERNEKRKKKRTESFIHTEPTKDELKAIHQLYMETVKSKDDFWEKKALPPNSKWMKDHKLDNLVFCHPENRNIHNQIFGGFIVRQALELSWASGFLYTSAVPKLENVSNISFYHPVPVGSVLKLRGSVVFTQDNYLMIYVQAETFNTSDLTSKVSHSFYFLYSSDKNINKVYPKTYLEAMKYLDGRRRLLHCQKIKPKTT